MKLHFLIIFVSIFFGWYISVSADTATVNDINTVKNNITRGAVGDIIDELFTTNGEIKSQYMDTPIPPNCTGHGYGLQYLNGVWGCNQIETYSWSVSGWSACSGGKYWSGSCSTQCGTGTEACIGSNGSQSRSVTCVRASGGVVPDNYCTGAKPATSQPCNTTCGGQLSRSCSLGTCSWSTGGWSSCSASPIWGSFGSCSATCGGGSQSRSCNNTIGSQGRTVSCLRSDGTTMSDGYCASSKPTNNQTCSESCSGSSTQSCNTQSCVTYSWVHTSYGACSGGKYWSGYGGCSAGCGWGTQYRSCVGTAGTRPYVYQCRNSLGSYVSDSFCSGSKPTNTASCNTTCSGSNSTSCYAGACITYSWYTGGWSGCSANPTWTGYSSCSASCGWGSQSRSCYNTSGSQSRTVYCRGSNGSVASDGYCAGGKPSSSISCSGSCSGSSTNSCYAGACLYTSALHCYGQGQPDKCTPTGGNHWGWYTNLTDCSLSNQALWIQPYDIQFWTVLSCTQQ